MSTLPVRCHADPPPLTPRVYRLFVYTVYTQGPVGGGPASTRAPGETSSFRADAVCQSVAPRDVLPRCAPWPRLGVRIPTVSIVRTYAHDHNMYKRVHVRILHNMLAHTARCTQLCCGHELVLTCSRACIDRDATCTVQHRTLQCTFAQQLRGTAVPQLQSAPQASLSTWWLGRLAGATTPKASLTL